MAGLCTQISSALLRFAAVPSIDKRTDAADFLRRPLPNPVRFRRLGPSAPQISLRGSGQYVEHGGIARGLVALEEKAVAHHDVLAIRRVTHHELVCLGHSVPGNCRKHMV